AIVPDFEKLGVFYLGREYDIDHDRPLDDLLLYESKDLLTHAVCVGMTGSGKTGLCLTLLEEAAIDGIPALVIDPKGDLANLLLTFPHLRPEDFQPWVHADDARRRDLSVEEYARQQAELWTKGLAEWGQDGARIQRLRDAADFAVYTPGSSAGLPISVLRAFAAPAETVRGDAELLADRVNSTTSGLLALVGLDANPLESREHILLATLLDRAWRAGENLDLPALIQQIQNPPIAKLGAIDVDSFFPAKERFALALRLNNLLSAPGFASWLEGESLDIGSLLHTPTGKPRIAIFSIAHLDDSQRMFFVSLLLNETLAWVRAQAGTTSLRALLYMDEIFGYFPPVSNPPSKKPLLTLLKQARAYGLGVVLATQNPVDLDYKGLANAGTWFIGRLQTERDKARVLEGLKGASLSSQSQADPARLEQILSALKNRVFLMHNVHEDHPVVFQARWAMSYLCGPLARDQIKRLMDQRGEGNGSPAESPAATPAETAQFDGYSAQPPLLPPQVAQYFVPLRGLPPTETRLVYAPRVLGLATIRYVDAKLAIDSPQEVCWLARINVPTGNVEWQEPVSAALVESELETAPRQGALFGNLPPKGIDAKSAAGWQKSLADALYQ
ncbi:MAG: ATP-binding protein, partial [Planctomycetaceae bacterium]|nr:ATP-binding protein [Planctomycetaceae bacterium]